MFKFFAGVFIGTIAGSVVTVATAFRSRFIREATVSAAKDAVSEATEAFIYGNTAGSRYSPPTKTARYRRYDRSKSNRLSYKPFLKDEVMFSTYEEAIEVTKGLREIGDIHEIITVSDVCEMLGLPYMHEDTLWGWNSKSLSGIKPHRVIGGWKLDLPEPSPRINSFRDHI